MREFFNEAGKINILIAVSLIILIGFGLYLLTIGNKVRQLEKEHKK